MGTPSSSHLLKVFGRRYQVCHLCANSSLIPSHGALLRCGHPLSTGFWDISQPTSVVVDLLCMPHPTRAGLCAVPSEETVKWLYQAAWCHLGYIIRSTVDGMFTESLLKVVLPASSVAPLFKNLRYCVLQEKKNLAVPCYPQLFPPFAQVETHILDTLYLMDTNSCE